jgi:hypothetical protein
LASCYSSLATRYWLLASDKLVLAAGYWLLVTGYLQSMEAVVFLSLDLLLARCEQPAAGSQRPVKANKQQPATLLFHR